MVARPGASIAKFVPAEPPRISISPDGSLAAIGEARRVVVVELPGVTGVAEIGTDPEAAATEVVWVGAPARLLVLSRYATYSTVHLLDPRGPRSLAEIRLESPMRLFASTGPHALTVGATGAAVLTAGDAHLTPYQFPSRAMPLTAGAAAGQFLVALPGAIEEWDPQSRMPKRRLRLPRPAAITALGGSERVVWMTTQQEPARIDVIQLVTRGQPKSHDLPEPIAQACGHPRSDLVLCLGAETGRIYLVDLDGKKPPRPIALEGIDRADAAGLVVGRLVAALGAQARRPLALLPLDEAPPAAEVRPPTAAPGGDDPDEPPKPSTLIEDDFTGGLAGRPARPGEAVLSPRPAAAPPRATTASSTPLGFTPAAAPASSSRQALVGAPAASPARPAADAARWRDDVVAWARAVFAGVDRDAPPSPAADAVAARFELPPPLRRTLLLLYGAHLCGDPGAAPVDVARVNDRAWDEALGRGRLAEARLAVYEQSRVRLAPALLRALDELPPATGTLVGVPGAPALLAPWAVVSPEEPLASLAVRLAAQIGGAVLAAHPGADPAELLLEARARGAVALLRVPRPAPGASPPVPPDEPSILAVDDEAAASQLEVPLL